MPGGRPPLDRCKICGQPVEHRSFLTKRGRHLECSLRVQSDEISQLRARSGPHFTHWRRQMAASVGGRLLDASTAGE